MSRLIIHIGGSKCGSSTIQSFLKQNPFGRKVKFSRITKKIIDSLHQKDTKRFDVFMKQVNRDLGRNKTVIISHEYLLGNTECIKTICNSANTNICNINIIGYSRPQSGFLTSAYSQWEFRSKESHDYFSNILRSHNINSSFFTGLEAFLISIILTDFDAELKDPRHHIYKWEQSFGDIRNAIPNCKLIVNTLPSSSYKYDLIEDFCKKTNLSPKRNKKGKYKRKVNTKFNSTLTESFYNALTMNLNMPNKKYDNYFIEDLSVKLGNSKGNNSTFITKMADYIDSFFYESNKRFCQDFNIPANCFNIKEKIDKAEILAAVNKEIETRKENPDEIIQYYKNITGQWAHFCFYSQQKNTFKKISLLYKHIPIFR